MIQNSIIARPPGLFSAASVNSRVLAALFSRWTSQPGLANSPVTSGGGGICAPRTFRHHATFPRLGCPSSVIKRHFSIHTPLLTTFAHTALFLLRNPRSDPPEDEVALRSWLGERTRIPHGQMRIAGPTRDHACGNPRGTVTLRGSSDREIGNIEKTPAPDGRNLAE